MAATFLKYLCDTLILMGSSLLFHPLELLVVNVTGGVLFTGSCLNKSEVLKQDGCG